MTETYTIISAGGKVLGSVRYPFGVNVILKKKEELFFDTENPEKVGKATVEYKGEFSFSIPITPDTTIRDILSVIDKRTASPFSM